MFLSILEPGTFLTIEPGIYFIPALLEPALENPIDSQYLNEDLVRSHLDFGGVRIEDVFLVTESEFEWISIDLPRTVQEIEELMGSAKKQ